MSHVLVVGATPPPNGSTPNRLEINTFVNNAAHFSLFIQALTQVMSQSQADPSFTSYFQMGGIHGLPFIPWSGSGGVNPVVGTNFGGYCTHGTVLFPTWHRPYVALFEQVIQRRAIEIALTYTVNRGAMLTAATQLRLPYWDWGVNAVPPPQIIELPRVPITAPDGTQRLVTNPFLAYQFNPLPSSFPSQVDSQVIPLNVWPTTLRYPTDLTNTATSNFAALRTVLNGNQSSITNNVFNMLIRTNTWANFSNHIISTGPQINNIESVHDQIHGLVGGSGHMSWPIVAAFDPIFWLHHANVDRLLSLWSAITPGVWVTPGSEVAGTFTTPAGASLTVNTDLTPFWASQTTYWASTQVQTTTSLNYTYPEFNGLDIGQSRCGARTDSAENYEFDNRWFVSTTVTANPHTNPVNNEQSRDWTARIQVEKYALNGSFFIVIFLGPVPSDSSEWYTSPSFVGSHFVFANPQVLGAQAQGDGHCANCQHQAAARIVVEGFVHLNTALARVIADSNENLTSFDPADVVPYLTERLSWRALRADHTPINAAEVPISLDVEVSATPMWMHHGDQIPSYGEPDFFPEVTAGRNA
ncbi:hypothetical protein B0H19DRAFT_1373291 [Mycena capillaripes]|nr:hypothetical protein B0H19DRAFT_1373291 [Mycena capillaripes]